MRNDSQKSGDGGSVVPRGRVNNGILPNSFRAFSSYLKIVSSGASTVASTVRSAASAASAIVERDGDTSHDQVSWAGFDKLELEKCHSRQVLLLGSSYGFQIWDVEAADNVRNIVSRHDGPVSFMQVVPKPLASNEPADKFADSRPLLVICADGSFSGDINVHEVILSNGMVQHCNGSVNCTCMPTVVWFYSRKQAPYLMCVDVLKSKASNDLQKLFRGGIPVAKGEALLPKLPWAYPLRTRQDSVHPQLNIANDGVPKGGGMTGATHRQAEYGEVIGEDLGRQFDILVGWLSRVMEGPITDKGVGAFEFADVRKE